jgi:hypothetical protein
MNGFLKAGGYNEAKYNSWGPDDKDFHIRMMMLGIVPRRVPKQFLMAVLHNNKMRFREYPEALEKAMTYEEISAFDKSIIDPIANYGKYGMGTVFRNFEHNPIVLGPIPTRIFGIGMHKTATTSLHKALQTLGFDSAHWKSVKWAKGIWNDIKYSGKSRKLEHHYALSDLPFTLLFRELDASYPGSKFILTIRDEIEWLESVRSHWLNSNRFKDSWEKEDSFGNEIHERLYGQTTFDPKVFIARYRLHNAEVQWHFRNRPNDLLVMDMGNKKLNQSQSWMELCTFLERPFPATPYPHAFVTEKKKG